MNCLVLYIHGINVDKPGYSDPLHKNLTSYLWHKGFWNHLVQAEVFWGDMFSPAAAHLLDLMRARKLGWQSVRRFSLDTVAQALGYEDVPGIGAYERVHERVAAALHMGAQRSGKRTKVVVVAHSLGSIVASNYVWDVQHHKGIFKRRTWDEAQTLEHLRGIITMGSPLALYNSRFSGFGTPIKAGSKDIPWWNVIEHADPLAWPLKGLNDTYDAEVGQDVIIRPPWWNLTKRTPLIHGGYWTSKRVAATIGDMILKVTRPKESK